MEKEFICISKKHKRETYKYKIEFHFTETQYTNHLRQCLDVL